MNGIGRLTQREGLMPGEQSPQPDLTDTGARDGGLKSGLRQPQERMLHHRERFDPAGRPEDIEERAATFERRIESALEREQPGGEYPGAADARLLASAGAMPLPDPVIPQGRSMEGRIEAVERQIAAALPGKWQHPSGEPLSFLLQGAGLADTGLASITLTLTPEGLDVTLVASDPDAGDLFRQAAQALADRLQHRFPRRLVRIFEAADDGGKQDAAPDTIAALFAQAAGR